MSKDEAISVIQQSGSTIKLSTLSNEKNVDKNKNAQQQLKLTHSGMAPEEEMNPIFLQLLGHQEIDYVVEEKKYGKMKPRSRQLVGTDLRATREENKAEKLNKSKTKKKRLKRHGSIKKLRSKTRDKKALSKTARFTKGEDNIAFVEEGQFLDFTLKKVEKHATCTHLRNGAENAATDGSRSQRLNSKTSHSKKPDKKAYLPIKTQLKWSFEETNSRQPGQSIIRVLDDANQLSEVIEEREMNYTARSHSWEDEDLMMTTHLNTELATVNSATQSENAVSINKQFSRNARSAENLGHSDVNA